MVAPAGTIPNVEARSEGPILVQVIHSVELQGDSEGLINMPSPLKKEFIVCNTDTAEERDCSSSGDEISIHVESPSAHDQSLSSSALTAATTQPETDDTTITEDLSSPQRRSRVHFRSRVRITSGLHHGRVSSSSLSSSPSSSISAPLRAPLTEADSTPGWGTLGQRVGLFAVSNRLAAEARSAKHRARRRALVPNEHDALLGDPPPPRYDRHPDSASEDGYSEDEYQDGEGEALLSHQIDLVFGKWPGRLLNRQWWWWQLQPILCCGCLDEPDGEN
ncbi:hypothetical protein B0H12DRAFT_1136541 [Mycena haematopus]|nr:hypothetical protein B0H12DRAFT_1136541 [Mycena haematopus]